LANSALVDSGFGGGTNELGDGKNMDESAVGAADFVLTKGVDEDMVYPTRSNSALWG
jgi:hypothetical protein